jgi:phosphatidylglycerol:prolipoprotein diacylglycerol transferase
VHPYLIHSVHFLLPTFGVLAAMGLMAALTLSLRTAALAGLSPDRLWNAGLVILLSAFVLSRLLIILANPFRFFVYPLLVLTEPSLNPTGILLTLIATTIYLRIRRLPLLATLDAWSPCATLPKAQTPASPPRSLGASPSHPTRPACTPWPSTPPWPPPP